MLEMSEMPNRSDLCEIYEQTERIAHFYHQTSQNGIILASRAAVGKDQRAKFRSTIRSMVRNMKETFPPKTGLPEKQVLQDPGYVEDVGDALLCAGYSNNTIDSFHYFSTNFK